MLLWAFTIRCSENSIVNYRLTSKAKMKERYLHSFHILHSISLFILDYHRLDLNYKHLILNSVQGFMEAIIVQSPSCFRKETRLLKKLDYLHNLVPIFVTVPLPCQRRFAFSICTICILFWLGFWNASLLFERFSSYFGRRESRDMAKRGHLSMISVVESDHLWKMIWSANHSVLI